MAETRLSVVIVDDEPPARELLRGYAARRPELMVAGEAEDGDDAVQSIRRFEPDLVFLDVQMPGMDGFEVVAQLEGQAQAMPRLVFVTAYDRHAVRAFDVNAADYLLKPVSQERFDRAVDRVLATVSDPRPPFAPLLEDVTRLAPQRLLIRDRGRIVLLPVSAIDRLEAEGDYVRVHAHGRSHLMEKTLADMEGLLAPHGFVRIHRGAMVNLERVKELYAEGSGRYRLTLVDGTELVVSRSYSHVFRKELL
jgi:two-component system, LytTR family, response regulator